MYMICFVVAVWLVCIVISFLNGRRWLPFTMLFLGAGILAGIFMAGFGYFGVSGIGFLAVILLVVNKVDSVSR